MYTTILGQKILLLLTYHLTQVAQVVSACVKQLYLHFERC